MQKILDYSVALALNNERSWFHAHKDEYKAAMDEFLELIRYMMPRIHEVVPAIGDKFDPKTLTYRVPRDLRFSHDKTPYNPAFRFHIGPEGRKPVPMGYFIQIQPGNSMLYTGMHFPEKNYTKAVRDSIVKHSAAFEKIIKSKSFKDNFELTGEKLKNIPKGYDADHPLGEYLKHKTWDIGDPIPDEKLRDFETFTDYIISRIILVKPLIDFLNSAIEGV